MKKYKILIVCMIMFALTALLLSVSACTDDRITIEDYSWRFDTAVSGGKVTFVSEDNATAYPEATVVDGVLRAKDGELRAEFNGKVYSGTYSVFDRAPEAVNYNVKLFAAEQSEYAVVAFTEYSDGTAAPTLVLSLPGEDGYAVYFTGFKEQ